MIKTKKGNTHIEGTKAEIRADICCVLRTLKNDFTEDEMKEIVQLARMSDEEMENQKREMLKNMFKNLFGTEEKADEEKEE